MEKVTGIGGVFFRARDPEALKKWYETHLGITISRMVWPQEAGLTVFMPFAIDTDYFPDDKQWMINFRVKDLNAMIVQLKSAGIEVETRAEWDHNPDVGRFARIHDPEGNPVELWQSGKS